MDHQDRQILAELQRDSSRPVQDIADKIGLSATPTARRIRLMKEAGIIAGERAILDKGRLGLGVCVFIFVRTNQHNEDWLKRFAKGVSAMPEIVEFHRMSGDIDYVLRVVVPDIAAYDAFYKRLIEQVDITDVSSTFAMECIKYTTALPLEYV